MRIATIIGSLAMIALVSGCVTPPWSDPKALKVDKPVSMPLFYINDGVKASAEIPPWKVRYLKANMALPANLDSTWNYLSKSDAGKKKCRDEIKATTKSGEIPGITFMLSTAGCGGPLSGFPNVTDDQIRQATDMIKELCKEGFVTFACLYVDDPSGSMPKWWEIEKHQASWVRINSLISPYVSAYVLAIESNEKANSKAHLEGCINAMRVYMPGAYYYGTHMEFGTSTRYSWNSISTTPNNADFILNEPWDIFKADAAGLNGMKNRYNLIKSKMGDFRLIWHEYNINPKGNINIQQRDWLKDQKKEWGVG